MATCFDRKRVIIRPTKNISFKVRKGYTVATCFDRKRVIIRPIKNIFFKVRKGYTVATCFDRKRVIIRPIKNILLKVQKGMSNIPIATIMSHGLHLVTGTRQKTIVLDTRLRPTTT